MNKTAKEMTTGDVVRQAVGSRIASFMTKRSVNTEMVMGQDGTWRPAAYGPSCPDACGPECPMHAKRNAKLARRAARARAARAG